jgi:hypothetical protein
MDILLPHREEAIGSICVCVGIPIFGRVVLLGCGLGAFVHPVFDGLGRAIQCRINKSLLLRGELPQDVVGLRNTTRSIDANAEARPLLPPQDSNDIRQTIVASGSAKITEAKRTTWKGQIIDNNQEVLSDINLSKAGCFGQSLAGTVHKGRWLQQPNRLGADLTLKQETLKSDTWRVRSKEPPREAIQDVKPDVVPGPIVFGTWIA